MAYIPKGRGGEQVPVSIFIDEKGEIERNTITVPTTICTVLPVYINTLMIVMGNVHGKAGDWYCTVVE